MILRAQFGAARPSRPLVVLAAILALLTLGVAPRVGAQSVVVNSSSSVTFLDSVGNTATDFPAPFTAADFANAQAGPSATVLSLIPSYTPSLPHGPNAVWIGTNVSAGIAAGDTALYAASFTLPSGVSSASLTLYYAVDNGLGHTNPGIYINGTALPNSTVPSSSCVATGCAFLQEQIYTDANIGPLLVSGTNWIYFDAVNLGGPGGLIFSAVITYGASTGTPAAAAGYAVSNFATGFPNSGPGGVGPIGLAFDALGNLYVTDYLTGILYKFPPNGGVASAATQVNTVPIPGYPAGLAFAKDGSLFCARQQTGDVVQLDPSTGAILRTVATIPFATGIATDPLTGDLFVSDPALPSNSVFRVSNFANTTSPGTVAIYASVAGPDGLSFGADGSLYTAALEVAEIAKIAGTNSPVAGQVTYLNAAIPSLDGMAMSANPNAQFLYTNRNNGIITKADLSTTPPTLTDIFTGGSRGDFVTVGPDGCLYATQTDRILKVTNADGTCVPPPLGRLQPVTGSAQEWVQLAPSGGPPQGRVAPSAAYISSVSRLLIFGGYPVNTTGNQQPTNDLWALDGANGTGTAQWTQLIPPDAAGSPSRRTWAPAAYDPTSNRMIVFGGESSQSQNYAGLNDVWVLTDADGRAGTPTWSQLSVTGTLPGPRTNHAVTYDPVTNRLIVYGGVNEQNGTGGCPCTVYNDTWVLTNANGTGAQPPVWSQLSPTGTAPTLSQIAFAYDPAQNVLIVYGGYDGSGNAHTDTWVLSNANGTGGTPAWTQLATVGTPPQSAAPSAGYDPATQRFFIFGGDVISGTAETSTNTTYVLTDATGKGTSTWQLLNVSGTVPTPRTQAASAYDSEHNSFMVFGGQEIPQAVTFNDSWVLTNANGLIGSAGSHVFITTSSLPSGEVAIGYTATLEATGGVPPYIWSVVSDSLLTGVTLSTSGVLSGTPTTAGAYSFTLQVTDSAFGTATQAFTVTIAPAGTGSASATTQPSSLAFGNQVVTTSSTPQAVTITSNGTAPFLISSIAVAGTNPTDFSQTNNCPLAPTGLGPGESCQIFVTFAPIAYGPRSATLTITDNQGNVRDSQQSVVLTGTGVDVPVVASTTYNITGTPFTTFTGSATCPPDCNITGSFTLPQPLPPNLSNATIAPTSFSFTVGTTNLNPANVTSVIFAGISTDASGYITNWAISLSNANFFIVTNNEPGDVTDSFTIVAPQGSASNSNSPATWPKTVVTPVTFNASPTPVSNSAVLNCPSGTVPCTDPNAHSLKLTVPAVSTGFTLTVTSIEVPASEANGVCEAGHTEATDFDCRFVDNFTLQQNPNSDIVVPQCNPYSNGNCVFYRVSNTPPETSYTPGVLEYIAWNNTSYTPPPFYNANNPRLLDDPDDPPYGVNHQFVFDITTYYKPTGNFVGIDNGIGGRTLHFNDFVVAYSATPSYAYTVSFVPPLSSTATAHFEQGDGISVRFNLSPNSPAGIATQAPNHVGYSVLLDNNNTGCADFSGTIEPTVTPANSPLDFTYDPEHQHYDLRLRGIYPAGQYKLLLSSNLAPEQCAVFAVTSDN